MPSKSGIQQFTQSWNKTVNWAKQNNIPYAAYYPVYQMDTQRLLSTGSGYSETERIKAIEASSGLNYSNALPTDNPSWTDLRGNSVRNAQNIFIGLEPTHLVSNVLDTFKSTIEHPGNVLGAIGDLFSGNTQAAANQVLKPNNILSWAPGVYDLAQVFSVDPHLTGSKGAEALAKDPITSVLDVLPFGRLGSEVLGRTAVGDRAATRIGLTTPEMRKLGIWRVGGKLIKATPVSAKFTRADHPWLLNLGKNPETGLGIPHLKGPSPDGMDALPSLTVGDFWNYFKQKVGASGEHAQIGENRLIDNGEGTQQVARIAAPALTILNTLRDDEKAALFQWSQKDFRPLEDKMADTRVPQKLRNAYYAAYDWGQQLLQLDMQSGKAQKVRAPFNDVDAQGKPFDNPDKPPLYETYYVDTAAYKTVTDAFNEATADNKALNEAMRPIAIMLFKMDEVDRNMTDVFDTMDTVNNSVFNTVRQSIPTGQVASSTMTQLRGDFASDDRWEQAAVDQQTPTLRNLLGLEGKRLPDGSIMTSLLTKHHVNAIRDLFAPGGLIGQMVQAYRDEDWIKLNKISKIALRKFNGASFKDIPTDGAATLFKARRLVEVTQKYAVDREKLSEEIIKRVEGKYRGAKMGTSGYKKSMAYLSEKATKSQSKWLTQAIKHPPDVWRNAGVDEVAQRVAQEERTAAAMEETTRVLSAQGWKDSELTKLMESPRTMQELMTNDAKASLENAMLPDVDHEESGRVTQDMYENLASLRARGQSPLHVHMLAPGELKNFEATYNVYIRGLNLRTPGHQKAATWGFTPSIYDIGAGLLQQTKDMVEHDMMQRFIDQEVMPRLYDPGEIQGLIRTYFKDEIAASVDNPSENALSVISRGLDQWGLKGFDKDKVFGSGFTHPNLNNDYYISKDLESAFAQTIQKFQFPAHGIIDRGTKLFRFSILSLSPRYTAHILLGGTFLVALRGTPGMLKFIGPAIYFATHGSFSEKTLQHFPDEMRPMLEKAQTSLHGEATSEGLAAAQYQYARGAMRHFSTNVLIPSWIDRHLLSDTHTSRLAAMADLNTRFTRAVTTAQKAVVYLDGAAHALDTKTDFYADELVPRTPVHGGAAVDAQGRPVNHPITGRVIHDQVRSKVPISPEQAHQEGMRAVGEVVGNLRHMTPLERNTLTRVFPFYGWTKHILKYVMSYPFDHPWRAMILSQIAIQNTEDIQSGLPLRIGLLTMLGQPDQYGNVTADDTKSLDPLRDTANYASWTGLFESLNPAVTGFFGLVDPQASFGSVPLYPTITFNQLYGSAQAGAQGNLYTAAEQFVPEITAADAAFNLSGQYAYLSKSNPQAFTNKIVESLGLPFMPEHLNLRQIAAKQEISRYQESAAAAKSAAEGNQSALAGYGANTPVPDPLNPMYNVTPAYIAALNDQSEQETGLPWYATGTAPPSPPI